MRLVAVAFLLALLSGCADAPHADAASQGPPDAPPAGPSAAGSVQSADGAVAQATPPRVVETSIAWDAQTMGSYCAYTDPVMPGCFGYHLSSEDITHRMPLPAGAESLLAELTWTADDVRTETLTVYVEDGEGTLHTAEGPSPLVLDLRDLPRGTVTLWAYPPRPAAELPVQAHHPQPYHAEVRIMAPPT